MTWHKTNKVKPIENTPLFMRSVRAVGTIAEFEGHYAADRFWTDEGYRGIRNVIEWCYDQHTAKGTIYITEEYP